MGIKCIYHATLRRNPNDLNYTLFYKNINLVVLFDLHDRKEENKLTEEITQEPSTTPSTKNKMDDVCIAMTKKAFSVTILKLNRKINRF